MTSPAILVALPVLGGFLLPVLERYSEAAARAAGPVVLLLNVWLSATLWHQVAAHGALSFAMGGFPAPLGIVLYVDQLAALFVVAASTAGLVLWPRGDADPSRERVLTLALVGGVSGLALSGDIFTLYVFYEITAVASYGLSASRGTGAGYAAALRFLLLGALGSALALLGIALIYAATGTLNLADLANHAPAALHGPLGMTAFGLILVGFGVKAELFPVNTWVPEVYGAAPVRVSGLLAGVVSKLALLIVLRLLVLLFEGTHAPLLLLGLGVLSILSGELAAWRAVELRRMLAFSSVGQLGLLALAFSVPGAAGVMAGLAVALHHMVVKPALFLLSEAWGREATGGAHEARLAAVLFVILALSLVGVPPLPGFWAKFLLLKALLGVDSAFYGFAAMVVLAATVVEAAYLLRVVVTLYRRPVTSTVAPRAVELLPAWVLGGALLVCVPLIGPLAQGLTSVALQAASAKAYVETVKPLAVPSAGGHR